VRFQINFLTPVTSTFQALTANCPIMHGINNSNISGAAVPMDDAEIRISGTTYLFYRKVTYAPEDMAKISAMIARGHKITIEFPSTDVYPSIATNVAPNSTRTDLVSPSTVAPLRVWQLLLPAGYFAGSLANIQSIPMVTNSTLTRGNILINSQRYYDNDLGQQGGIHDFWQVFDEQTVGHGFKDNLSSLIGLQDFLTNYNLNVYDVSRLKDRLPNPAESVNLQVNYTTSSSNGGVTNNSDVLYLVERNTVADIVFSSSAVSIALGSVA
jgi:hypothetical protein